MYKEKPTDNGKKNELSAYRFVLPIAEFLAERTALKQSWRD
jgi:hypothetical protein